MVKQNNQSEVKEIWVPCKFINKNGSIEEYPGYEVSNLGRILSLNYHSTGKPKVMKFGWMRTHGTYYQVKLWKDKKRYHRSVHRLVLSSFNPKGYFEGAVVDHIDSNPSNNRLGNLHWVTVQENNNTPHLKASMSKAHTNHPSKSKQVKVTFLEDGHTETFPSAYEVERAFNLPKNTVSTRINQHCNHYKKFNLLFEYI